MVGGKSKHDKYYGVQLTEQSPAATPAVTWTSQNLTLSYPFNLGRIHASRQHKQTSQIELKARWSPKLNRRNRPKTHI